ncbi:TPA: nucleotide-binding protein [Bacillus thuringiensis]|nr:nucleotide-binding protein [Bacillus thuringiensis]
MITTSNRTYYHTSIHQKNAFKDLYELDSENRDEIIEKVIIPYIKNEKIHFDGYFIEPESIDRIVIKQSSITSKNYIETVNFEWYKSRTAAMMGPEDIIRDTKYATDITKILFELAKDKLREEGHAEYKISNGFKVSNDVIVSNDKVSKEESKIDRTKVFIVHGHDELAKIQASDFVRKLGLTPIILHQQASGGKTIIEKIESYSNVGFGIVLYTPCDLGSKVGEEKHLSPRARQNVVFEHGFLIGKIGRENVAALVKETVETPNDIAGVVYISMTTGGDWEIQLARELKSSGYDIDFNKLYN